MDFRIQWVLSDQVDELLCVASQVRNVNYGNSYDKLYNAVEWVQYNGSEESAIKSNRIM